MCFNLYHSLVLPFNVLIQPYLLFLTTFTPSTTLLFPPPPPPLALLDFFHLMTWNNWPIRFRHLSDAPRGLACSTTLLLTLLLPLPLMLMVASLTEVWPPHDKLHSSSGTFDTLLLVLSHDATPLSPNLIDINDSSSIHKRVAKSIHRCIKSNFYLLVYVTINIFCIKYMHCTKKSINYTSIIYVLLCNYCSKTREQSRLLFNLKNILQTPDWTESI